MNGFAQTAIKYGISPEADVYRMLVFPHNSVTEVMSILKEFGQLFKNETEQEIYYKFYVDTKPLDEYFLEIINSHLREIGRDAYKSAILFSKHNSLKFEPAFADKNDDIRSEYMLSLSSYLFQRKIPVAESLALDYESESNESLEITLNRLNQNTIQ